METDRIICKDWNNKIAEIKENKTNFFKLKKIWFIITFIILFSFLILSFIFIKNKISKNNLKENINIAIVLGNLTKLIQNIINPDENVCIFVKNQLKNRAQPFDFENELFFFADLISCKIPFSFIRFGDGENSIMKGDVHDTKIDKWYWNPKNKKFQDSLIESASICMHHNNFIGIPCKNWNKISESILSYSKCSSAKYMSYATLFINKNFLLFKIWILSFINTTNRWKIILVANSIIHKSITWAYKFFPVPDHLIENWDKYSISLLSELSHQAKENDLIFFISAGPAANIIISYLSKINNNNTYIDFGSSIEFITKGYTTRSYAINGETSFWSCEPFFLKNKLLIYTR